MVDRSFLVRTEDVNIWAPLALMYLGISVFIIYIIKVLLLGRIFKKAGESSWKAWVPLVNTWTYFKIAGYNGANVFWLIGALVAFGLIPLAGLSALSVVLWLVGSVLAVITFVFGIAASLSIQKKLGKPLAFIILLFINLIAPLWMWILALDYSKWNSKKGHGAKSKKAVAKKKK